MTNNGVLGAEPTAGSRGRAPAGGQGQSPPEAESHFKYQMSKIGAKSPLSCVLRDKIVRDF